MLATMEVMLSILKVAPYERDGVLAPNQDFWNYVTCTLFSCRSVKQIELCILYNV